MGKKIIRSILLAVIIAGTIVIGVGCAIALPALDPSKLEMPDNVTQIYSVVNPSDPPIEIRPDAGEAVPYEDLKPYVKQAIIATEDRNFYNHNGIDYRSIARAIYRDILAGGKVEGASTITQQLAKNAYLTHDKTYTRKIQEIALAAQIEREYTKDDILEMYMNKVNFHPSAIGIQAAAKIYFNKSAVDLTLGQAAFLAGLPQAPSTYYDDLDKALERREIVLQSMVRDGYISQQQADEAAKEKVDPNFKQNDPSKFHYPHYIEYVLEEAEQKYDIPREQVMRGGLRIYTYLDPKAQNAIEKQFKNPANFPANGKDGTKVEGAMVIVDPKTGGIRAMVGSRNPDSFLNLNRAFQMKRQPGSSIKPLMVYGPAIDKGEINPNTKVNDKKGTVFPGNYSPNDWDNHTMYAREQVTVQEALRWSFNIPAVSVLQEIGVSTGRSFAEKAGMTFDKGDNNLALALGAMTTGTSPLQMADAFQAFDNKGKRIEAHAIQKITTSAGTLMGQENPANVQVMKESTAATMTNLMKVVVDSGTGTGARMNRPVAGKTGTQEYSQEIRGSNRDAWFVGYTPELVASVWMGFDNNDHYMLDQRGATVSSFPTKLFSKVMTEALQGVPVTSFNSAPVEEKEPEKENIQLSGEWNGKTVMLKWNKIKTDAVYQVFRVENLEHPEVGLPLMESKDNAFVDTDVEPGKTYYYAISAVDPNNRSKLLAESNKVTINTTTDSNAKPGDNKPQDPTEPTTPDNGENSSGDTTGPGGTSGNNGTPPGSIPPGNNNGGTSNGGNTSEDEAGDSSEGTSGGSSGNSGGSSNGNSGEGSDSDNDTGGIIVPNPVLSR